MKNRSFLGVWMPVEVLENKDLSDKEKILISIIFNLSLKEGYCYASNRYLSNILGITIDRTSKIINKLKDKRLITVEFEYKEGTKEIARRRVILKDKTLIGILKNNYTYSSKRLEGIVNSNQDIKKSIKKYNINSEKFEQRKYDTEIFNQLYCNGKFIEKQ